MKNNKNNKEHIINDYIDGCEAKRERSLMPLIIVKWRFDRLWLGSLSLLLLYIRFCLLFYYLWPINFIFFLLLRWNRIIIFALYTNNYYKEKNTKMRTLKEQRIIPFILKILLFINNSLGSWIHKQTLSKYILTLSSIIYLRSEYIVIVICTP